MDEFKTINDIINESVVNSSYVAVLISSSVFIIYTLIIKLIDYFKSKNKNNELSSINNSIKTFSEIMSKQNAVIDRYIQNVTKKDLVKCKNAIDLSFISYQSKIEHFCRETIIHNNIEENKDLIKTNIHQIVNAEYYKLYSILSLYEVNELPISNYLKPSLIEETTNSLIGIIYNNQDARSRITQINNKLTLITSDNSVYIYNKTFGM